MKDVLIIGDKGNMASRYKAIFKMLGITYLGVDVDTHAQIVVESMEAAERFLIVSPTETHISWIKRCIPYGRPILCEKPVSMQLHTLDAVLNQTTAHVVPFRMVFQYSMLVDPAASGPSSYDYFKHGNDGLQWDCMQIIALANDLIDLGETSPIWKCKINGQDLRLSDMDQAYVDYIKLWETEPGQDPDVIWQAHVKTKQLHGNDDFWR